MPLDSVLKKAFFGIALFSSFLGCAYQNKRLTDTQTNCFVDSFPEKFPALPVVYKSFHLGATRCLVHIRQLHHFENESESATQQIQEVHKDIYQILKHLVDSMNINKVYKEGRYTESDDSVDSEIEILRKIGREFQAGGIEIPDVIKFDDQTIYIDAVTKLVMEGKIKMRGAERAELNKKAIKKSKELFGVYILLDHPYIRDDRENALLEILSEHNESIAITMYGGAHDWRDNIRKWNQGHEDKFSLIEITPRKYLEYYPLSLRK